MLRTLTIVLIGLFVTTAALAQPDGEGRIPRTPWGAPDLQGTWSLPTMTPLERPAGYEDRPRLTDGEAEEFLITRRSRIRQALAAALSADFELGDGGVTESIYDAPLLDGRTSLVVSPSTGRISRTPVGEDRAGIPSRRMRGIPEGPEDRAMDERCMLGGSLPLRGSAFPARIFQTAEHLVIHYEFVNATIIVPLDDRPPVPTAIRQWTGTSRGSWEGDTLVIESTNFDPRWTFQGSGAGLRLVQRLTRIDQDTMHLEYTVHDPESFTEPWSAAYPLTNTREPIYEYACHEGNRSMSLLLSGARATEEAARFVGSFDLSSFEPVGEAAGEGPVFTEGMLSYHAGGRVSAQLTTANAGDRYLAYYGSYYVNVTQGIVRHYVERGSAVGLTDRTFTLRYELDDEGKTLILSELDRGQITSRSTWHRHR
ncbi:MAG: hypothetical protein VX453_02380 [Acidobacteriota bacterium]|nr:hypothetical protein [Acidobacteriota bacterium]